MVPATIKLIIDPKIKPAAAKLIKMTPWTLFL